MWDQADVPPSLIDPDAALFDFDRDILGFRHPVAKRRFFRYLSLHNDDEYASGLTAYISATGIVGLEAHFTRTSRLSGCRNGCVLHFPFLPNEWIAYAWLRI